MNLRLALLLTVVLASAPVLFAEQGVQPDLRPLTGWITDRGQATQAAGHQGAACVVVGADLLRPHAPAGKGGNGYLPRWNRTMGLPMGEKLVCATAQTGGV